MELRQDEMGMGRLLFKDADGSHELAYLYRPPRDGKPVLFWLSGFRSDMTGSKAIAVDALAADHGFGCLRFDYSGHGQSGGAFRDGTISRWLAEAVAILDHLRPERILVIGSSMGGWIALRLLAELRARAETSPTQPVGLVLIAPAPDFTSALIEPNLPEDHRRSLEEKGYFEVPTPYGPEPHVITARLLEDGRRNQVLSGLIETGVPVHILQGMQDRDVPYRHALRLMDHLPSDDVVMTLIRDGDHRLSRPQDLQRLNQAILSLVADREKAG